MPASTSPAPASAGAAATASSRASPSRRAGGPPRARRLPTPGASATATATVARPAAACARTIAGIGGRAQASPDGKWLAVSEAPPAGKVPYVSAALVYDLDGKLL